MDRTLRFRLNGETVGLTDVPPTTTLLNWLRYERGLTGTKEGCAEGDCGACTVALREAGPDGLMTRPVCACIQLMGMLHGRDVVTVEALAAPDGRLHPVQRAMVDCHGSQCGFCTPGFVMSLWCGHRTGEEPTPGAQNDLLAGNLCRCTGYGPILEAGRVAHGEAADWEEGDAAVVDALAGLGDQPLDYLAAGRRFLSPVTVDGLAEAVAEHPDATILSGATDIGLWVTKQGFDPEVTIYTGRVAEMHRMEEADGVLTIGAAATYSEALDRLSGFAASLGGLVRRIGARQVRAMGTIGGNIANGSPIGDMPPALIALGARLECCARGPSGVRSRWRSSFWTTAGRTCGRASSSRPCGCRSPMIRRACPATRSPSATIRTSRLCWAVSTSERRMARLPPPGWPSAAWPGSQNGRWRQRARWRASRGQRQLFAPPPRRWRRISSP